MRLLNLIIGEIAKMETNGKWFLEKRYGVYNPFYEPNIITSSGNVVLISDLIRGNIKWKVSSLDMIFGFVHYRGLEPLKFEKYSKGKNILMLE